MAAKHFNFDLEKFVEDANLKPEDFNNYTNLVICFDDIDRKSPKLDLLEIYGFINNLVENKNAKVILIANEDTLRKEIQDDKKDNYSILREKVIGISLPFNSNVETIINDLLEGYRKENNDYFLFLKEHSSYLSSTISIKDNNLRNIIFFFENFKEIFNQVNILINERQNLKEIKNTVLVDILEFTLPIAIEYKLGMLDNENLTQLYEYFTGSYFSLVSLLGENVKSEDISHDVYVEKFIHQYKLRTQNEIKFFPSIWDYIIGANILDKDSLFEDLKEIYRTENENFTEKELVFKKLSYWKCMNLSYNDYKNETKKMIKLMDENKLELYEFPTVFHYITRFDNPLRLNIIKLKNKMIKKINTGNFEYVKNINSKIVIDPSEKYLKELKEIIDVCDKRNKEIAEKIESEKYDNLFSRFKDNFDMFIDDFQDVNNNCIAKSFFAYFEFSKLWRVISKLSNLQLIEFGYLIEWRYSNIIYEGIKSEKKFLESFKKKLEYKSKLKKINKLDLATYNFIINKINNVLPNFEKNNH